MQYKTNGRECEKEYVSLTQKSAEINMLTLYACLTDSQLASQLANHCQVAVLNNVLNNFLIEKTLCRVQFFF
jgi:hypothetical protein